MGLSLCMKIDEHGNAVPGPTSHLPVSIPIGGYDMDDEEEDDEDMNEEPAGSF
jgi:DNA-directed RNA polymerase subunit alpha